MLWTSLCKVLLSWFWEQKRGENKYIGRKTDEREWKDCQDYLAHLLICDILLVSEIIEIYSNNK